jgi:hypothetical protein
LATENPRKYIQEEGPASPPQVERFCKASPSLGVDMENGSRMRRTQKRENKNTTKRTTSTATTTTTAAEEARTWSSLQSRQKKERRETKKKRELDSSVTDPQRKRKCKLRMQVQQYLRLSQDSRLSKSDLRVCLLLQRQNGNENQTRRTRTRTRRVSFLLYRSTALRFETKAARRLSDARGQLPVFFLPYSNLQGKKEQRGVFFL